MQTAGPCTESAAPLARPRELISADHVNLKTGTSLLGEALRAHMLQG